MNQETILTEVNNIFIDVLDDENIKLERNTTEKDIEEWDSLTHIQLVVAVEKRSKIRFKSSEINSWARCAMQLSSARMHNKFLETGIYKSQILI